MIHQSTLHYRRRKQEGRTIKCPCTDKNGNPCPYETPYGKSRMDQHILQHHTTYRPFCCNMCGKTYNQKWNMDKHRKQAHGIPLPSTKTTRHAERTSLPAIFKYVWTLTLKSDKPFKHRELFERYEGRYENKQTCLPSSIKSNMSRLKRKGYIDYGWKIMVKDTILEVKKKHSKKSIILLANFMNQLHTLQRLHTNNLSEHLTYFVNDYPKSRTILKESMRLILNYTRNI